MTYCVALKLNEGLVLLSDTRTNAGIDNVSKYRKMFNWAVPGERAIALMTSGNLSVTQAVISQLQESIDNAAEGVETILTAPSMFRVAELVGDAMRNVQVRYGPALTAANASASIILAGQIKSRSLRLFMVYSAGNFIEATDDTNYLQIGEIKYGKPILDRVVTPETSIEDGLIAVFLSMDSTMKSNMSVGMPLDVAVILADTCAFEQYRRIEADDPKFIELSTEWSEALRDSFVKMRPIDV
ncbi:MAG: peptidase [Pseudomonadota bacterium]